MAERTADAGIGNDVMVGASGPSQTDRSDEADRAAYRIPDVTTDAREDYAPAHAFAAQLLAEACHHTRRGGWHGNDLRTGTVYSAWTRGEIPLKIED